jgi:hypothetical protein
MSWVEKKYIASFDALPIEGLHYLDGDLLARLLALKYGTDDIAFFNPEWLTQQKMPQVEFPSGATFELWESSRPEAGGIVHIFGEMDLPYFDTRDAAWEQAHAIAQQVGYLVNKHGEHQLELIGHDHEDQFIITYHPEEQRMADIAQVIREARRPLSEHHEPLLDPTSRARLPKLYANEALGLDALAQVKFFTPSSNWTWYASEASAAMKDGTYKSLTEVDPANPEIEDVIFFGLVNGFELELGYFALSELQSVGGGLQLPIERDRHFRPTSLKELQEQHRQERDKQ